MENRHKDNHTIPSDILDDLASRFIINVPIQERSDIIRICFQIELAHWFYLDFYCSAEDEKLIPCGIKQFANHIFQHIPFLTAHIGRINDIMAEFKVYKMSVPTYGAILLSEDFNNVLLVQSYWARSSWGFPKGKVNEDEEPLHCAIREVHEETGYDISKLIQATDYIDGVINYQYTRLYIVKNVPTSTIFVPRTRKEIKCCEWFQLDHLPSHKSDLVSKLNLGINPNSFFMIMPFVKRLKRWLAEQNQSSRDSSHPMKVSNGSGFDTQSSMKSNSRFYGENAPSRRERLKSTGDLDDSRKYTGNVSQSPHYIRKKDKQTPDSKSQYFLSKNDSIAGKDKDTVQSSSSTSKRKAEPKTNTTATANTALSSNHTATKTTSNSKATNKSTAMTNLVDLIQNDKNIKKWGHFSFAVDKIVNVFAN